MNASCTLEVIRATFASVASPCTQSMVPALKTRPPPGLLEVPHHGMPRRRRGDTEGDEAGRGLRLAGVDQMGQCAGGRIVPVGVPGEIPARVARFYQGPAHLVAHDGRVAAEHLSIAEPRPLEDPAACAVHLVTPKTVLIREVAVVVVVTVVAKAQSCRTVLGVAHWRLVPVRGDKVVVR